MDRQAHFGLNMVNNTDSITHHQVMDLGSLSNHNTGHLAQDNRDL